MRTIRQQKLSNDRTISMVQGQYQCGEDKVQLYAIFAVDGDGCHSYEYAVSFKDAIQIYNQRLTGVLRSSIPGFDLERRRAEYVAKRHAEKRAANNPMAAAFSKAFNEGLRL